MVGALLMRGMLAGLAAGVLAFGFAWIFGEPQVDRAIAFEALMAEAAGEAAHPHDPATAPAGHSHGDAGEEELVSRAVQSTLGLLTASAAYGTAIGGLFALVFAYASGRIGRIGPRGLSALLALAGFVAIVLVPGLKYPPNPPAVGDPETIVQRTQLFFAMLALTIAAMIVAVGIARQLAAARGPWNAGFTAAAAFVAIVAAVQYLLPEINEVPENFPADLLWRFRVATLGIQAVLWTTLGLLFGWLTERSLQNRYRVARPAVS